MNQPAARTKRTTSENRLETDPAIRLLLFLGTAAAAYALALLTPYGTGPSAWIAAVFVAVVLPLILSVVLPETLERNRLLALFLCTLVGNFVFILVLLSVAPRFSFGASSYLIPPALAALVLTTLVSARAGLLLVVLLGMGEIFLLRPDSQYIVSSLVTGLAAILLSRKITRRSDLLRAGAGLGLVALLATVLASGLKLDLARNLLVTEAPWVFWGPSLSGLCSPFSNPPLIAPPTSPGWNSPASITLFFAASPLRLRGPTCTASSSDISRRPLPVPPTPPIPGLAAPWPFITTSEKSINPNTSPKTSTPPIPIPTPTSPPR
ncbi:MAG: hypothetical protein EBS97_07770 [Verrucomicrobia bacterium]|nr:hypothetical protein [Verrucomicrobiota bacterium]